MAQQERARRTRDAILEAAGEVFAERGYEGATVSDVYCRAGLTKGAFYFHFASKRDLAEAVLSLQIDHQTYPVLRRQVKLQELVDSGFVLAHRLLRDSMLRGSVNLSMEPGAHQLDRRRPFIAWIDHNHRALREASEHGELYAHVDTTEVAELMVSSFSGAQMLSEILTGRQDLPVRVASFLAHLLPSIAVPTVLAKLDIAADRGERVMAEVNTAADASRHTEPGPPAAR